VSPDPDPDRDASQPFLIPLNEISSAASR
jgi:hypothetical protein